MQHKWAHTNNKTKGFTYNFCYFATLPEGLDSEGVEGPLHGDGIHLHHSVILTKHKQTLMWVWHAKLNLSWI